MFCKRCGMKIDDTASFCEHCGADQRPAAAPQPEETGYRPSEPQPGWQADGVPMPGGAPTPSTPYLVWSILVTLFCCLPLGIPAIVFAAKIDSCNARGDFASAAQNARRSKLFMIWGAVLSVVLGLLYLLIFALMFAETNFHF